MDEIKRYRLGFLGVAMLFLWPTLATALEHRDFSLENGLRVILVREAKSPVVVSQIWYRVGAADEVTSKTGLAHMLEHMMFQGTKEVPDGEFNRIVSSNGGDSNASTSHDFTNYYIKLAADRLDIALHLEADRMRSLQLGDKNFHSENLVVQEERRTRTDDDPNDRFLESFRTKAYTDKEGLLHPYGRPVIGWMTDIQGLTRTDAQSWYDRYYTPDHAILVIVGDLEFAATTQKVRNHFAALPASSQYVQRVASGKTNDHHPEWPTTTFLSQESLQRFEIVDQGVTLPVWHGGYIVPSWSTPGKEDVLALDVLASILGGGSSSRLYKKLIKEEGLAVSVSANYDGYAHSWELFSITAVPKLANTKKQTPQADVTATDKDYHKDYHKDYQVALSRIERSILQEVTSLATTPVSQRELERTKNSMIAGHVFARDSIHKIASYIGLLSAGGLDWIPFLEDYPKKIRSITVEDVQRVAAHYLKPEKMTIGVLHP